MTVAELIATLEQLPPHQTLRWSHYGVDGVTAGDLIAELEAADPATRLHGQIELDPLPPLEQDSTDWKQRCQRYFAGPQRPQRPK
jgi:hypothetical protein